VKAVDSILIDTTYRRRLNIKYTSSNWPFGSDTVSDSTYWIEGIGSTNTICRTSLGCGFELPQFRKLICYKENSILKYSDLLPWYTCDSILIPQYPIGINEMAADNRINIYPNPVTNELFIQIENATDENEYILYLYDITGSILNRLPLQSSLINQIQLSNYSMGIYVAKIDVNGKIKLIEKIIKN
jgi:hypothetical protein